MTWILGVFAGLVPVVHDGVPVEVVHKDDEGDDDIDIAKGENESAVGELQEVILALGISLPPEPRSHETAEVVMRQVCWTIQVA
jgi:hypothetical protein